MSELGSRASAELSRREALLSATLQIYRLLRDDGAEADTHARAVAAIGPASGASSIHAFENRRDIQGRLQARRLAAWRPISSPDGFVASRPTDLLQEEAFTGWASVLSQGEAVVAQEEDLSPAARELFGGAAGPIAVLPLLVADAWSGLPVFTGCWSERPFSSDDVGMLRMAAESLSAVLEHLSARHQLRSVVGGARCRLWHARVTREASGACFWDLRESDEAASRRFLPLRVEEGQAFHSALWHAIPVEDRQAMDDVCFGALSREDTGYRQVYRCCTPDGQLHWIREDVPIQPVGGGCYLLVGVCTDITEQRLQEEALSASESRFRSLVETCPAAVGLVSLDGTMLLANQAAVLTNGASRTEEMVGGNIISYLAPEGRERGVAALARISELETFHGEFTCVRRDGARFPADVSARLVRDGEGAPSAITVVLRDLSAQKAAEEERARSLERDLQLRRLESLMGLAGGVAHDFNNLLTGVLGHAELAMARVIPGSPAEESLRHVLASAHRAADLSRRMLAYSGHASFEVGPLDLTGLLLDSSDLLRAAARAADLRLQVSAGPHPWTQGDGNQIAQVLLNLVSNAYEALPMGRGSISVSTGVVQADTEYLASTYLHEGLPEGAYSYLEVVDNGSGMEPATLARLFDPFFSTRFAGRGLGMAAVLGTVRGHKGAVRVRSQPGSGTCVRVLLPWLDRPVANPGLPARAPADGRRRGVWVVDDDPTVLDVVRTTLEGVGYDVVLAPDGASAVEAFRQREGEIHAVLLDLVMPGMDGAEAFRELRKLRPRVAVVLMTGHSEAEAVRELQEQGLRGFLRKPFRPIQLVAALEQALVA